jgi:hypothetical protein
MWKNDSIVSKNKNADLKNKNKIIDLQCKCYEFLKPKFYRILNMSFKYVSMLSCFISKINQNFDQWH